jgi:HEAT repeat protein
LSEIEIAAEDQSLRAFLRSFRADNATLERLKRAIQSADQRAQLDIVRALGLLGIHQAEARQLLIDLAVDPEKQSDDPVIRRSAVQQLGRTHNKAALNAIMQAFGDPDLDVRQAAQTALEETNAHAEPDQILRQLPLTSTEATEWIAPFREIISRAPELTPRERIAQMTEVETLRFELHCPHPRIERIQARLTELASALPALASLAMTIRGQIEFTPQESAPEGGVP